SCASTTAIAGATATTQRPRSPSGPSASPGGASRRRRSSTSTTTGGATRSGTRSRSCGGCGGFEALERSAQQPRHVHLRVADSLADLALREVLHEAQLEHLPLDLRELAPRAGDRLAILDEVERRVVVTQQVHERGRLAIVADDGSVERRRLVAGRGLLSLQHLLDAAAQMLRHLAHLGRAAQLLRELLGRAADRER